MECPFCKETIQEGALKCRHCGSMLNAAAPSGTQAAYQSNVSTAQPGKFNVMALLFSTAYYAGYGKVGKGILLSVIGFIPLTLIGVGIYAGMKANGELPVGKIPFSWGKAIGVSVLHSGITIFMVSFLKILGS